MFLIVQKTGLNILIILYRYVNDYEKFVSLWENIFNETNVIKAEASRSFHTAGIGEMK